jgi:hypothetical protein
MPPKNIEPPPTAPTGEEIVAPTLAPRGGRGLGRRGGGAGRGSSGRSAPKSGGSDAGPSKAARTETTLSLHFSLLPEFSKIPYVIDYSGIFLLTHYFWSRLITKMGTSNIGRVFSQSMFTFSVARICVLALMLKARNANLLPVEYLQDSWLMSTMDDIRTNLIIPKYLADAISTIGTFTSASGSRLHPSFPDPLPDFSHIDSRYATSIPTLNALARVISNEKMSRDWNNMNADPAAAFHAVNNPHIIDAEFLEYHPGFANIPTAMTVHARAAIANIPTFDGPELNVNRPMLTLMAYNRDALSYMGNIFIRTMDEGIPSRLLTAADLGDIGSNSLRYYISSSEDEVIKSFFIKTMLADPLPADAANARLFQLIRLKTADQVEFNVEIDALRWPITLINEAMAAQTTPPVQSTMFYENVVADIIPPR